MEILNKTKYNIVNYNIGCIYAIVNKINNKKYIGSTKDLDKRVKSHINNLNNKRHSSKRLQKDWDKYKEINFFVEILELVNKDELLFVFEQKFISEMKTVEYEIGYNISPIAGCSLSEYNEITNNKVIWKGKKSLYTKIFSEEVNDLFVNKLIDLTELGLLTLLSRYLAYESNELKLENGNYICQLDIINISGLGRTKIISILKKLKDNNILLVKDDEKDKRKNIYFINPNLFFKGKKISQELKEFYL